MKNEWNVLEAEQRKNRRLRRKAVMLNLPGIRELIERRMARIVQAQERLFR